MSAVDFVALKLHICRNLIKGTMKMNSALIIGICIWIIGISIQIFAFGYSFNMPENKINKRYAISITGEIITGFGFVWMGLFLR